MALLKKKLSKRAQQLLDEIQSQEIPMSQEPGSGVGANDFNKLAIRYMGSKYKFSAVKYRKFSAQNQMILWSVGYIVLGAMIFFVANNGWGSYQTYSEKVMKSKQKLPKVLAEIKNIEKNAQKIQQDILNKKQNIQDQLNKIPSESAADELVNQVAMLLENGDLKIVKQEIQIKKSLSPVTFSIPPLQKPVADTTIFSNIAVPMEDDAPKAKKDKKNVAEKLTGKKMRKGKKKDKKKKPEAEEKPQITQAANALKDNYKTIMDVIQNKEAQRKQKLMKSLPKNVSFMTYHFQLKGQYLDYLKARQDVLKQYPYLIIPVEEIVTEKNQDEIQFRVIYDIPFFTENNPIQSTKRKG